MVPLNVIALISGGKDSLFSILHCLANGHHVVALANLHPPLPPGTIEESDDLNSYMYQTVGHSIIPLYELALKIPLYRQEISGAAVNKERDYKAPDVKDQDDETESLVPLLQRIVKEHPEADAVSTGAILSTYQRTRVESVALRLGLTPLSFLWQYPALPPYSQSALLRDMGAVGQDARVIKVASGGIDESFLGLNVADPKTIARLGKAVGRFGGNADGAVLGEGGEFETLALDGPGVLWKSRIEVEFDGAVSGEGGNAIAKWKGARVVEKELSEQDDDGLKNLRIPGLWDEEFEKVNDMLSKDLPSLLQKEDPAFFISNTGATPKTFPPQLSATQTVLAVSNLRAPKCCTNPSSQLNSILETLSSILEKHNIPFSSILHTTLLLRSMSTFTTLNPIYSNHFTHINPPSRVTIACGNAMPEGVDILLSAIIDKTQQRKGLHVQSRSYWAPANIGPYSQAISAPLSENKKDDGKPSPCAVYVAGQIPLIPATMEFIQTQETAPGIAFLTQTTLALQHLFRIGRTKEVNWWTVGIAYISTCSAQESLNRARIAQAAWNTVHEVLKHDDNADNEEDPDIDVWDIKHGGAGPTSNDKTIRHPLPNYNLVNPSTPPPCLIIEISTLPRNTDIEWTSTGISHSPSIQTTASSIHWTRIQHTNTRYAVAELEHDVLPAFGFLTPFWQTGKQEWDYVTIFASAGLEQRMLDFEFAFPKGTVVVPCFRVWGSGGRSLAGAVVGRRTGTWVD